jgi:hypothetical protein
VPPSQFGWLRKFRRSLLVDSQHLALMWRRSCQPVFGIGLLPIQLLEDVG